MNTDVSGEKDKPHKKKNRFLVALSTLLVIVFVVLAVLLVGVRLFGLQVYAVLSGSMEPEYHTGSLIYVRSVDYKEIQPGQVITFMLNEDTVATHRVVEVVPDEEDPEVLRYRTKGDANDVEDGSLVHYKNVLGTPVFTIPYLGFLSAYIQKPPGLYIAVAASAIALIIVFLPDLLSGGKGDSGTSAAK
ncbi:MAG: signal peptidase I [Acutalibacteraceae bacterium]